MTFNLAADASLLQAFATLPDPRKSRNQIYPLNEFSFYKKRSLSWRS
jgi:hypothetical protein